MTKPACVVTFLLDRSGSMESCRDATIEAFNGYLEALARENEAEIAFTLLQFDSESLDKLCVAVPVAEAPRLSRENFVPRASTPLVEAAVTTIKAVEAALEARSDHPRVVICFQTDGLENASRQHSWEALRALIAQKTAAGWQFNFMGADIDTYQQGARMGISFAQTMSYDKARPEAARAAMAASARSSSDYAAGRRAMTDFLLEEKIAAGDRFIPDALDLDDPAPGLAPNPGTPAAAQPVPPVSKTWQRLKQAFGAAPR
jgi:hypothetical protein